MGGSAALFWPTFRLVQERLDAYDVLICDDIGYVKQSADEVEVLFTLMAERYEPGRRDRDGLVKELRSALAR